MNDLAFKYFRVKFLLSHQSLILLLFQYVNFLQLDNFSLHLQLIAFDQNGDLVSVIIEQYILLPVPAEVAVKEG